MREFAASEVWNSIWTSRGRAAPGFAVGHVVRSSAPGTVVVGPTITGIFRMAAYRRDAMPRARRAARPSNERVTSARTPRISARRRHVEITGIRAHDGGHRLHGLAYLPHATRVHERGPSPPCRPWRRRNSSAATGCDDRAPRALRVGPLWAAATAAPADARPA